MYPSQQRLEADHGARPEVDDRLIAKVELPLGEGTAHVELERAASLEPSVHLRLEEPICAPSVSLGEVERHVRILEELFRISSIVRPDCDPDAGAHDHVAAIEIVR